MSPTQAEIIKLKTLKEALFTVLGQQEYTRYSLNERIKGLRKEVKRLSKLPEGIGRVGEVILQIEALQSIATKANREKAKTNSELERVDHTLNNMPEFA